MTPYHDGSSTLELGQRAPAFEGLLGTDGRTYSLSSFDGTPLLALVFSSNSCPTAKGWEGELVRLAEDYRDRGLQLVIVNSNNPYLSPLDSHAETARRAQAAGATFLWLSDPDASAARAFGAICTPTAFLLDEDRRVRYSGRLGDSRRPETAGRHDLREAVCDLVENRPVRVPETVPFGCSIVW